MHLKKREEADAINAVPAQYGYKPDSSFLQNQAGAASIPDEPGTATFFTRHSLRKG